MFGFKMRHTKKRFDPTTVTDLNGTNEKFSVIFNQLPRNRTAWLPDCCDMDDVHDKVVSSAVSMRTICE